MCHLAIDIQSLTNVSENSGGKKRASYIFMVTSVPYGSTRSGRRDPGPAAAPSGLLPVDRGGVCCRSRLLLAALPGTGPASRHLIGRSGPCRPRPLEAAGARGRSGSLRSPDRARWAAELGAGRRAPDRSWAGGPPRREGGRVPARKALEGGVRCRGWCLAAPSKGSPGSLPAARRQHLSTLAPPLASSSGRAALRRRGTRTPAWRAHQLSGERRSGPRAARDTQRTR